MLADFLLPMLEWNPGNRATAQDMLSHPWLTMDKNYDYKVPEEEFKRESLRRSIEDIGKSEDKGDLAETDYDMNKADIEDNDEELLINVDDNEDNPSESGDESAKKYSLHSNLLNVEIGRAHV